MSDSFKIIGIGGAGINSIPPSFSDKSFKISSENFHGFQALKTDLMNLNRTERTLIISSPAGLFSSYVLPEILRTLNERGETLIFISIEPFSSESKERRARANETLRNIKKYLKTLVRIENDNFVSSMENSSWAELLDKVNSHISTLVEGLIKMDYGIPDTREIGLYHSEGVTVEELEKNLIFSNSKPSEGMIGTADVRNLDDLKRIRDNLPVEILSYRVSNKLSISGVLLYSHANSIYSRVSPSEHGIRIH